MKKSVYFSYPCKTPRFLCLCDLLRDGVYIEILLLLLRRILSFENILFNFLVKLHIFKTACNT